MVVRPAWLYNKDFYIGKNGIFILNSPPSSQEKQENVF